MGWAADYFGLNCIDYFGRWVYPRVTKKTCIQNRLCLGRVQARSVGAKLHPHPSG
jgi:hypothetical protein